LHNQNHISLCLEQR